MTFANNSQLKSYAALFAVYLAWGTTFSAMRVGLSEFEPFVFAAQRFLLAGSLMLLIALAFNRESLPSKIVLKRNIIAGLLLLVFANGVTFWTLQYLSTSFAALMVAMHPFWMLGLSAVFPPREPVKPMSLLGLMIGFAGLSILMLPELRAPQATADGMLLPCLLVTILTGFSWAMGSIYMRKNPVDASVMMSVGIQNLAAGIVLLPVCFLTGENPLMIPHAQGLAALLYLVLVGSIIGMTCYQYTIERLPVAISSTFAYVTPLITVLTGWMFLGEQISSSMILGGLIILAGVMVVQTSARKKPALSVESNPAPPGLETRPAA